MCDFACVNWGLELLKVTPTIIVAVMALSISRAQKNIAADQRDIAKAKLNLDLFERRMKVFDVTWGAASRCVNSATPEGAPIELTNLLPTAGFLFGPEVETYMRQLVHDINELAICAQVTRQRGNIMDPDRIDRWTELNLSIVNAATDGIRQVFGPYLNFANWK